MPRPNFFHLSTFQSKDFFSSRHELTQSYLKLLNLRQAFFSQIGLSISKNSKGKSYIKFFCHLSLLRHLILLLRILQNGWKFRKLNFCRKSWRKEKISYLNARGLFDETSRFGELFHHPFVAFFGEKILKGLFTLHKKRLALSEQKLKFWYWLSGLLLMFFN